MGCPTLLAVFWREGGPGIVNYPSALALSAFLVTVLPILSAMSLSAQTIEIKLVDGRNGHPMVGASSYVNVWVGAERKEAIAIPMDEKGAVRLQLTLNPSEVKIPSPDN